MWKTTLMLPIELKERAQRIARTRGISFGELMRQSLESTVVADERTKSLEDDPFWADLRNLKNLPPPEFDAPTDMAANHDKYLYDDPDDL